MLNIQKWVLIYYYEIFKSQFGNGRQILNICFLKPGESKYIP